MPPLILRNTFIFLKQTKNEQNFPKSLGQTEGHTERLQLIEHNK